MPLQGFAGSHTYGSELPAVHLDAVRVAHNVVSVARRRDVCRRILVVILQHEDCRRLSGDPRFPRKGSHSGAQVDRGNRGKLAHLNRDIADGRLRSADVQCDRGSLKASLLVLVTVAPLGAEGNAHLNPYRHRHGGDAIRHEGSTQRHSAEPDHTREAVRLLEAYERNVAARVQERLEVQPTTQRGDHGEDVVGPNAVGRLLSTAELDRVAVVNSHVQMVALQHAEKASLLGSLLQRGDRIEGGNALARDIATSFEVSGLRLLYVKNRAERVDLDRTQFGGHGGS